MSGGVPDTGSAPTPAGSIPPGYLGWFVLISLLGAATIGGVGLVAGVVLLRGNQPTEAVAGALALIGGGLSFGLLANALLRR